MADSDEIDVKLGVTDTGLEAGMGKAADQTEAATQSMSAAFVKMSERVSESMARVRESVTEGLAKSQEGLESFAGKISGIQKAFALLGEVAILGFIGDTLMEQVKSVGEYGEALEHLSMETGIASDRLQELSYAAKTVGLSTDQMQLSMGLLSRKMAEAEQGNKNAQASFEAIGISMADIKNLSVDQVIAKIADAFKEHADGANKAALAMQLFGRSGRELIPLLNEGSAGLVELSNRAKQVGAVIDAETVEAMAHLGRDMNTLQADVSAASMSFKAQFAPALDSAVKAIDSFITSGGAGKEIAKDLGEGIKLVVAVVLTAVTAFEQLGDVINGISGAAAALGEGDFAGVGHAISNGFKAAKADGDAYVDTLHKMYSAEKEAKEAASEGEGSKPKFELPQVAGKSGAKEQFAVAQAEVNAALAMVKQLIAEQNALNEDMYKTGHISLEQYYDTRLALTKEGLEKEISAKQKLLDQTKALEGTATNDQERMGLKAKEVAINGQLAVMEEQLKDASIKSARERYDAQSTLNKQLLDEDLTTRGTLLKEKLKGDQELADSEYRNKRISFQQLNELELKNLNEQYDFEVSAIRRRLQEETNLTVQEKQKMYDQLRVLAAQHQTEVTQLTYKAADEENKYNVQATQSIDAAFTKVFEDIASGTKNAKTILMDFFSSLDQMLVKIMAQKFTENLLGVGTSGGGVVQALLGMVGLGGAAAGASFAGAFSMGGAAAATTAAADSGGMSALMGLVPSFDVGTNYVPRDTLAMVHQGEAIVPAHMNGGGAAGTANVTNHFVLPQQTDLRTQSQIASMVGMAVQQALRRNS